MPSVVSSSQGTENLANFIPKLFNQAIACQHSKIWIRAMDREFEFHEINHTLDNGSASRKEYKYYQISLALLYKNGLVWRRNR